MLVPARNEAEQIGFCVAALAALDYPVGLREFLVLDDFSEDDTAARALAARVPGLRVLRMSEHLPGGPGAAPKKQALGIGAALARGTLLVTTDADCRFGPGWLREIAWLHESRQAQLVAGPVAMEGPRTTLSVFQQLDFLSLQGITAAAAGLGLHSMGNGSNLAYTKAAFEAVSGFAGVDQLASGDDMLLMNKINAVFPNSQAYAKTSNAIVYTQVENSWRAFFRQRIRWASKARFYREKKILAVLALVYITNLVLLLAILGGLVALFLGKSLPLLAAGVLILLKTALEWPFMRSVARFYGKTSLLRWFLPCQPLHILYTVVAGSFSQWGSYQWKGRKLH